MPTCYWILVREQATGLPGKIEWDSIGWPSQELERHPGVRYRREARGGRPKGSLNGWAQARLSPSDCQANSEVTAGVTDGLGYSDGDHRRCHVCEATPSTAGSASMIVSDRPSNCAAAHTASADAPPGIDEPNNIDRGLTSGNRTNTGTPGDLT